MQFIKDLKTLPPSAMIKEGVKLFKEGASEIFILSNNNRLVGIITKRDLRFLSKNDIENRVVCEFCTSENLVVASEGTSKKDMIEILRKNKLRRLPILNDNYELLAVVREKDLIERNFFCFTMLPFKQPYENIFNEHIKKNIEYKFPVDIIKADEIFKPEPIIDTISSLIKKSDFLIAEITEKNPNVYYEIGYAHALGKTIIFITQDINNVPFDILHLRCIIYEYTPPGIKKLETELTKMINEIIKN